MTDIDRFINSLKNEDEIVFLGPCPIEKYPAYLQTLPHIIVDGGLNHSFSHLNTKNSISLGDNDSNITEKNIDILAPREKDESDLKFAFNLIANLDLKTVHLIGFLGQRRDHEYANLGEATHFLTRSAQVKEVNFEDKVVIYQKGIHNFNFTQSFSLLAFLKTKVKIIGQCQYQLKESTQLLPFSSHGLSNNAFGSFTIESENPFCLIRF